MPDPDATTRVDDDPHVAFAGQRDGELRRSALGSTIHTPIPLQPGRSRRSDGTIVPRKVTPPERHHRSKESVMHRAAKNLSPVRQNVGYRQPRKHLTKLLLPAV